MQEKKALAILAAAAVLGGALVGCNGGGSESGGASNASGSGTGTTASAGGRTLPSAPGFEAGDTIKVGVVASVTGDQKPWGEDQIAGAKLAVEEINAAGGIDGKKVEIVIGDSASKQEQAKTAAEKVLGENVIAIVGEVSSGNTIQIAKAAFDKGVPVVAVGATKTDLAAEGAHVFRVCYTDDLQGPVMAAFAFKDLNIKKIGVMTDNNLPYSQGLSESFKKHFEKLGGTIVGEAFYESGGKQASEYSGKLTELKSKNPEGLFLSGYFTEVGPIAKQARAAGITGPLLGGDGWDSAQILTSGGDAILGGFFCNHYNNGDDREQVATFLKAWRAKSGGKDPETTMAALGYDAMALTLDALKRAKAKNSKELITALEETVDFKGVSGDITLKGAAGNPAKRAIIVEVVKNGPKGWQKFATDYTVDKLN